MYQKPQRLLYPESPQTIQDLRAANIPSVQHGQIEYVAWAKGLRLGLSAWNLEDRQPRSLSWLVRQEDNDAEVVFGRVSHVLLEGLEECQVVFGRVFQLFDVAGLLECLQLLPDERNRILAA